MPEINYHHGYHNVVDRFSDVEYIVVHYTGSGSSEAGCAEANCIYFAGGNRNASAHYFIDDGGIWEYADPEESVTWHCGDGQGRYGITNQNSVGIEVCSSGKDFTPTQIEYLRQLVVWLQGKFGVPNERVVRHYDASRKLCPAPYIDEDKWLALRDYITTAEIEPERKIEDMVNCIVQVNAAGTCWYFSPSRVVALTDADQMKALQMADPEIKFYPYGEFVTDNAPWHLRLCQAINGSNTPDVIATPNL